MISNSEAEVICLLMKHKKLRYRDFLKHVSFTQSTLTSTLKKLLSKNIISKINDDDNNTSYYVLNINLNDAEIHAIMEKVLTNFIRSIELKFRTLVECLNIDDDKQNEIEYLFEKILELLRGEMNAKKNLLKFRRIYNADPRISDYEHLLRTN